MIENKKVFFRNNSEIAWPGYNVGGGVFVDIEPKSVFSVGSKAAEVLRKNLCDKVDGENKPKWLEEISEDQLGSEEKKEAVKPVEKVDEAEVKKIEAYEAKKTKTKGKK